MATAKGLPGYGEYIYVSPSERLHEKHTALLESLETYLKLRGGNHVSKEGKAMALAFADYKSYRDSLNGQTW
jgi:hypothetical protein